MTADFATINDDSHALIGVSDSQVEAVIPNTRDWAGFTEVPFGQITVSKAGPATVSIRPKDAQSWKAVNLRWVKLKKVD